MRKTKMILISLLGCAALIAIVLLLVQLSDIKAEGLKASLYNNSRVNNKLAYLKDTIRRLDRANQWDDLTQLSADVLATQTAMFDSANLAAALPHSVDSDIRSKLNEVAQLFEKRYLVPLNGKKAITDSDIETYRRLASILETLSFPQGNLTQKEYRAGLDRLLNALRNEAGT
ncbi:hypothetical protein J31TS4_10010 [Paenibacillus sp. J31TS4]|uniref:hypothetical protein n=1 Tax=Paenibacillus sp. J31TS4 TaxID=2807195 RepID=UPI001B1FFA85|nr:hypothetical protein [Paenibacillus sp. J31TS4]GIP37721.1 hypothetical protein J31TS4_10010 [Paenibacillus sp. J31TS4]